MEKNIMMISVIIPCLNEEKYIANCLESLLISDYDKSKLEILVVDGMSSDKTREIVKSYSEKYNYIKLLDNPNKIVPKAMNLAIKEAKGEYIIRLDAHSKFPKNYFSKLIEYSQKLNADNVGVAVSTEMKNTTKKSNSIKKVLSHRLGVGNSTFRTGVDEVTEVDTVPFGCYKREIFDKYGYYDERLERNQDIELNKRIINGGGKIYLIPDIKCIYYARETFGELAKNNYNNGFWNIITAYYTRTLNSLSLRHFIPLIFLLSLLLPLLLSPFYFKTLYVALFSLSSYLALVIITSFQLRDNSNSLFYLIGSFLTLHLSYGFGSLVGIFSIINKIYKR